MSKTAEELIEIATLRSYGHLAQRKMIASKIREETDGAKLLELRKQQFEQLAMEVNLEFVVLFLEEFGKPTT